MIGIYKITNIINQHAYIGQSTNIKKRWTNHKSSSNNPNSHNYNISLYRAFRKYGINNFTFEVIEECLVSELNDREIYWIEYFDTYYNGYNETLGGDSHTYVKINQEILESITKNLEESDLSISDISQTYNISYEMVQGINTGRYHIRDIDYPIRKRQKKVSYCIDCGKEIYKESIRCLYCYNVISKKANRPSKEELFELIKTMPFLKIGEMYGVSDNAIRKWCMSYGLPYKQKDIKTLETI